MPPCELRGFSRVDFRFSLVPLGTPLCTFPLVMQIPDKRLSTLLRIPRGSGFIPNRIFSQAYLVVFVASLSNLSSQPNGYIRALTASMSKVWAIRSRRWLSQKGLAGLFALTRQMEREEGRFVACEAGSRFRSIQRTFIVSDERSCERRWWRSLRLGAIHTFRLFTGHAERSSLLE